MRLIDADKCPCIQCEDTRNAHCTYEHRSCKKFCDWLNATAYDVEKVVAEVQNVHLPLASQTSRIVGIIRKGGVE